MIRPIHHQLEDRVRSGVFLYLLAYYVQWHIIEAWRPQTYAHEAQQEKTFRDPIYIHPQNDPFRQRKKLIPKAFKMVHELTLFEAFWVPWRYSSCTLLVTKGG